MKISFKVDKLTRRATKMRMAAETFEEERILGMILEGVVKRRRFSVKGIGMFSLSGRDDESEGDE